MTRATDKFTFIKTPLTAAQQAKGDGTSLDTDLAIFGHLLAGVASLSSRPETEWSLAERTARNFDKIVKDRAVREQLVELAKASDKFDTRTSDLLTRTGKPSLLGDEMVTEAPRGRIVELEMAYEGYRTANGDFDREDVVEDVRALQTEFGDRKGFALAEAVCAVVDYMIGEKYGKGSAVSIE